MFDILEYFPVIFITIADEAWAAVSTSESGTLSFCDCWLSLFKSSGFESLFKGIDGTSWSCILQEAYSYSEYCEKVKDRNRPSIRLTRLKY